MLVRLKLMAREPFFYLFGILFPLIFLLVGLLTNSEVVNSGSITPLQLYNFPFYPQASDFPFVNLSNTPIDPFLNSMGLTPVSYSNENSLLQALLQQSIQQTENSNIAGVFYNFNTSFIPKSIVMNLLYNDTYIHYLPYSINLLSNALFQSFKTNQTSSLFNGVIQTTSHPFLNPSIALLALDVVSILFIAMTFSFPAGSYAISPIKDREQKVVNLLRY